MMKDDLQKSRSGWAHASYWRERSVGSDNDDRNHGPWDQGQMHDDPPMRGPARDPRPHPHPHRRGGHFGEGRRGDPFGHPQVGPQASPRRGPHGDMPPRGGVDRGGPRAEGRHGGGRRGGGPHGDGPHGDGPHGGGRDRARRGEARFILLDVLSGGPKHGYEIIKAIEERSGGQYAPSPGTVYPTLQYLADQGMVKVNEDAERRTYELTEAGKAELNARAEDVRAFWSRFAAEEIAEASRHEVDFLQEALDDLNRTVWRGLREAIERGDRDTLRGVRQLIEQCRNDVRVVISDNAKPQTQNE